MVCCCTCVCVCPATGILSLLMLLLGVLNSGFTSIFGKRFAFCNSTKQRISGSLVNVSSPETENKPVKPEDVAIVDEDVQITSAK